jgi:hypothetical protein
MFIVSLQTVFQLSSSADLLVLDIKPEAKYTVVFAEQLACLTFYKNKIAITKFAYFYKLYDCKISRSCW